jgi:hypothetical protein
MNDIGSYMAKILIINPILSNEELSCKLTSKQNYLLNKMFNDIIKKNLGM